MQQSGGPTPSPWGTAPVVSKHHFGRRLLIVLAVAIALLVALLTAFPPELLRDGDGVYLARYLLIAAALIVMLAASRQRLIVIAGQLSIWLLLILGCVALYAYRMELSEIADRTLSTLTPTRSRITGEHAITFLRASDGHFWIDATVNGKPIRFLVDTGASGIVLNREDGERIGFDPRSLSFQQVFETANGRTRGASVELDELQIGPLAYRHVGASVNEGEMHQSLLGMRFLDRLSSVEIRGDSLTVRQ
jgi:aspartyl protease family protein